MHKAQVHKVYTASLQVEFEGMEDAFGMQDSLGVMFSEQILPILEKAFDSIAEPGATIVLDKLVLDCGRFSGEDWEEQLLRSISRLVEREIQQLGANRISVKTMDQQALEVMLVFVERGYFPWNSPFSSPDELEKSLDLTAISAAKLARVLRKSSVFRERFHRSFSFGFRTGFLRQSVPSLSLDLEDFMDFVNQRASNNPEFFKAVFDVFLRSSFTATITWNEISLRLVGSIPEPYLPIISQFFTVQWMQKKERMEEFILAIPNETEPEILGRMVKMLQKVKEIQPSLAGDLDRVWAAIPTKKDRQDIPKSIFIENLSEHAGKIEISSQESKHLKQPFPDPVEMSLEETSEHIFVSNAGLVLLHPFVPALFETLGLQNAGKFNSAESQMAAAKALQFLVWGENTLSENHFPLVKMLLGMPVHQVLDLDIDLSEENKLACEAMLAEVVGHWSVLKNTSVAGLRETFLQREGKLSPAANGWKLQVERKTVDVLLGKLPWGIGIIKLPWMNEMLYVDWN